MEQNSAIVYYFFTNVVEVTSDLCVRVCVCVCCVEFRAKRTAISS